MEAIEPFLAQYSKPDMAEILLELGDNEQEHVVIVHDESTVHSNDYKNNHYWLKPGEQVLKKKDEMVAENEKLAAELRLAFTSSTTVIYPDNKPGGDAYWNMEQMIAQGYQINPSSTSNTSAFPNQYSSTGTNATPTHCIPTKTYAPLN
ncbi:hypothetical protein B0H10DRAFT_2230734 [Mycena sp. CBHHK59/15]|nr:hypothetical protein B0H10DRAFT_2230734 [Mycena sp. CBHHK59/15]